MEVKSISVIGLDKDYKCGELGLYWVGTHTALLEITLEDGSVLKGRLQITDVVPKTD